MKIKLPYGLKNNQIITIDKVEKGLTCNCVCPACKKPLIARKGKKYMHHFSHYNSDNCKRGIETSLHLLAKEIIFKRKSFSTIPPVYINNGYHTIYEEKELKLDKVEIEKKIDANIPDLIIETKGKKLLIEIVVSNDIDYRKSQKIKLINLPTIVIYAEKILDDLYSQNIFSLENTKFEDELIQGTKFKRWIYNPKQEKSNKIIKEKYTEIKPIQSFNTEYNLDFYFVDNCPLKKREWKSGYKIGKYYASPYEDCTNCSFCIGIEEDLQINCIGDERYQLNKLIENLK